MARRRGNPSEPEFAAAVAEAGLDLAAFDRVLRRAKKDAAAESDFNELKLARELARHAFEQHPLFVARVELMAWKAWAFGMTPLARMGLDYSKTQRRRASKPRKVTKQVEREIRSMYAKRVQDGDRYGAIKKIAGQLDLDRSTVSAVINEEK